MLNEVVHSFEDEAIGNTSLACCGWKLTGECNAISIYNCCIEICSKKPSDSPIFSKFSQCPQGCYFLNNHCLTGCPDGFFPNTFDATCTKCIQRNCDKCFDLFKCAECVKSYCLDENAGMCIKPGFGTVSLNNTCLKHCPSDFPYHVEEIGICLKKCPKGYVVVNSNTSLDPDKILCEVTCPYGQYISDHNGTKVCVHKCPKEHPYVYQNYCWPTRHINTTRIVIAVCSTVLDVVLMIIYFVYRRKYWGQKPKKSFDDLYKIQVLPFIKEKYKMA